MGRRDQVTRTQPITTTGYVGGCPHGKRLVRAAGLTNGRVHIVRATKYKGVSDGCCRAPSCGKWCSALSRRWGAVPAGGTRAGP
jgi:hypothetical protein